MKRLVIVRHAKAEKAAGRQRDFDRPLAERGRRDAAEMGRRLVARGVHPGAVVASPALRTLETARLIARELDFPWAEIQLPPQAYDADEATLLALVRALDDRAAVALLVAHNPGVTLLAQALVPRFDAEFPTAGVAAVDLAIDAWGVARPGCGHLVFFDGPKSRP